MTLQEEIAVLQERLARTADGVVTVATAESATSGRIADRLTDVPGASDYFRGGIVAYSNEAKRRLLRVKASSLRSYGAVSPQVACEMAEGARWALHTAIAVSDTGIAGPGGATTGKPVGLFYLAIASPEGSKARSFTFVGDRMSNKEAALEAALTLLRDYLLQCCDVRGVSEYGSF
jgi:PncC family amidohydrolase